MAESKQSITKRKFKQYYIKHWDPLIPQGKGISLDEIFDACWLKTADGLKKKLNSDELCTYIKMHILPTIWTTKENRIPYKQKTVIKGLKLEVFA
ncbi:MAG: hypothetical protein K8R21_03690 [Leptospira sp.]|nr:hypothetical protein [Leptospira sp.]